jgi:outer membrane protein OmpA-like peptidoglycan-associated protein
MKRAPMLLPVMLLPVMLLQACASAPPPKELLDAKAAYETASKGPAAKQSPAELHVAKKALDEAEQAFAENGAKPETKDLAYVAMRRAQTAEALARAGMAGKEKDLSERDAQQAESDALKRTQQELNLAKTQLEKERAGRQEAERRLSDLRRIAEVKEEARGTVITLSGGVLFASNDAALMKSAMVKLDEAEALLKGDPEAHITVEGHTDSQGTVQKNQELSQKRAEAVRDYLASKGLAQDRFKALGLGSSKPVASNGNAEGRANNRRVEIVVAPAAKK